MRVFSFAICLLFICLTSCQTPQTRKQLADKDQQISQLEEQLENAQATNESLLDRLADLSIINKNDAESIRNSIVSINTQISQIEELTDELAVKDSINEMLVNNLRKSLIDFDDEDIQIEVRGNAVYVSISDKMLFESGSSRLSKNAFNVLEKVSLIVNDNQDHNVLVEGHTDAVPISNKKFQDNWDLSVSRATSVVRTLQSRFEVNPERLTAAGKAEFNPKSDNETVVGRSLNRRTEIIITPKLDQFFKLLEAS